MERIPPARGAATGPGHELIIEGREELLYLLGEAAELEHAVFCAYLYAAFSLRAESGEGAHSRAAAGRGGVEADHQPDRAAGDDPSSLGQQPPGSLRRGASLRTPQPLPSAPPTHPRSS